MRIMKIKLTSLAALALVGGLAFAPAARAADETPFSAMAEHYEAIWTALAGDSVDGVVGHAEAIAEIAETSAHPSEVAGIAPEIAVQARSLTTAADLDDVRNGFAELTKPLVRYRKAVGAERLKVAYCPMKKRAWLQPDGDIENPYFGNEMLTCGDFVGS